MDENRVLIVEDDAATRATPGRFFAHHGWRVTEAVDSSEAILALDAPDAPHDWMILDLMLPDGDGEFVLRKVRRTRLPMRVAVCTGTESPQRLAAVSSLRPDLLLRKPIDMGALLEACLVSAEPHGETRCNAAV
jgi:DNA-binding response OmpR family regulator